MIKKILFLTVVTAMLLSVFSVSVSAAETGTWGNVSWYFNNGTLEIYGSGAMDNTDGSRSPWNYLLWKETITKVVIENGITSIGSDNFSDLDSLTSVTIAPTVKTIGSRAFAECDNLKSITIPNGVKTIDTNAFSDCINLTSVSIPDSVISIESRAFYNCKKLTGIKIPTGVTTIGEYTFGYCESLTSVTIPDSVVSIEKYAFEYCKGLKSIEIPKSVLTIKDGAFANCESLTTIKIPDSVISLGISAFSNCKSAKSVSLGKGIATIDMMAFRYDTAITDVYYNGTKEQWKNITIDSYGNDPILNATMHFSGNTANYVDSGKCGDNLTWTLDDIGTFVISGSGAMYEYEFFSTPWLAYNRQITSVVVQNGVTYICKGAFYLFESLKNVVIAPSVTEIGNEAFYKCENLENLTLENGLTTINDMVFEKCHSLTKLVIPGSIQELGYRAFCDCNGVTSIEIEYGVTKITGWDAFADFQNLETIIIPDSVTTIDESVFADNTNLKTIFMGSGVTAINFEAFDGCCNLEDVYYSDTEEKWNEISIEEGNDCLLNAEIHFYEDGSGSGGSGGGGSGEGGEGSGGDGEGSGGQGGNGGSEGEGGENGENGDSGEGSEGNPEDGNQGGNEDGGDNGAEGGADGGDGDGSGEGEGSGDQGGSGEDGEGEGSGGDNEGSGDQGGNEDGGDNGSEGEGGNGGEGNDGEGEGGSIVVPEKPDEYVVLCEDGYYRYYLNDEPQVKWQVTPDGYKYYFSTSASKYGAAMTGKNVKIGANYYDFSENGKLIESYDENGNPIYYCNPAEGIVYTVTYDGNGGTASVGSRKARVTTLANLDVTAEKEGYRFIGWNTKKDAKGKLESYTVTGDVTLYAIYEKIYVIKCDDGYYRYYIDGEPQTKWQITPDGYKYYFTTSSSKYAAAMVGKNIKVGSAYYDFDVDGKLIESYDDKGNPIHYKLLNGFITDDLGNTKYYKDNKYLIDWQYINGYKYYFSKSTGNMLTGLSQIGSIKYNLGENGAWVGYYQQPLTEEECFHSDLLTKDEDGKYRYYVDGEAYRGWKVLKGDTGYYKYYFSKANGAAIAAYGVQVGGTFYDFTPTGTLINVSMDENGNAVMEDYILSFEQGAKNGILLDEDGYYRYYIDGEHQTGWQTIGNYKYYFKTKDGSGATGKNFKLGSFYYDFTIDGRMICKKREESSCSFAEVLPGEGAEGEGYIIISENSIITLPENTFTKEGFKFIGWNINGHYSERSQPGVEVASLSDMLLTPAWEEIKTVSDWVIESEAPENAEIVEENYTYTLTTRKTSTSANAQGWTLEYTETIWGEWSDWSAWSSYQPTPSNSIEVECNEQYFSEWVDTSYDKTQYHYFHFCSPLSSFSHTLTTTAYTPHEIWVDTTLPLHSKKNGISVYKGEECTAGNSSYWYMANGNVNSSFKPFTRTVTVEQGYYVYEPGYRYRTRMSTYVYHYKKEVQMESERYPQTTEGEITNVVKYVKYKL